MNHLVFYYIVKNTYGTRHQCMEIWMKWVRERERKTRKRENLWNVKSKNPEHSCIGWTIMTLVISEKQVKNKYMRRLFTCAGQSMTNIYDARLKA